MERQAQYRDNKPIGMNKDIKAYNAVMPLADKKIVKRKGKLVRLV